MSQFAYLGSDSGTGLGFWAALLPVAGQIISTGVQAGTQIYVARETAQAQEHLQRRSFALQAEQLRQQLEAEVQRQQAAAAMAQYQAEQQAVSVDAGGGGWGWGAAGVAALALAAFAASRRRR